MKKTKVSVITVVYNGVEYIENTILSVINQTYDNIEYIIVDGNSNDGTLDIINKYKDRISKIISEPDNGIYDAMNKGINIATGDWIHFRNCGDYFASTTIISEIFDTTDDYSSIDIIHGKSICWDKYGYFIDEPPIIKNPNITGMPVFHPSTFVRSKLHKNLLFNLKYKLAADHDLFVKCRKNNKKFHYIPLNVSIFNIGEGASIQGEYISMKEHFLIHGGDIQNIKQRSILEYNIFILKCKLLIKSIIPDWIMKRRRKKQNKILWSTDVTIQKMINEAINHNICAF